MAIAHYCICWPIKERKLVRIFSSIPPTRFERTGNIFGVEHFGVAIRKKIVGITVIAVAL